MRSVPQALTWELFRNGWWGLLAALLGANALPALILTALRLEGGLDPADQSVIVIHIVVTLMNATVFAAAVFMAQGHPSRLYAFPIPTATLVAGQMLLAMIVLFVEAALSGAVLNASFRLDWPIWGPSLFLACALPALQGMLWLTEKSAWVLPGLVLVPGCLGVWYLSRYGLIVTRLPHVWRTVTAAETLTMLSVVVVSYGVAVAAVGRDRCGEALRTEALRAWFDRLFEPAPAHGLPFRNAGVAQFWFEWRQKGSMPWIEGAGILVVVAVWSLFVRDPSALHRGLLGCGYLLLVLGLVMGVVIGSVGPADGKFEMGPFLASRPITDPNLAKMILKTTALNVIGGWIIWLVGVAVVSAILWGANSLPTPFLPQGIRWWSCLSILLASWTTTALVASLLLCGRQRLLGAVAIGVLSLVPLGMMIGKWALSDANRQTFQQAALVASGLAFVGGTVWAFLAAWKHGMIGPPTCSIAAVMWPVIAGAAGLELFVHYPRTLPLEVLAGGLAALAVAPLALTPLSLAWNRHR